MRELRQERDLTQGQLALYAGVAQSHISRLENDRIISMGSDPLSEVARALHTTTDYLLGLTANPFPRENPGLNEEESRLIRLFRSLHEDERGIVLACSEWLATRIK